MGNIYQSIQEFVGHTPLIKFSYPELPKINLYIKLEGQNPSGSIKDRACLYNIRGALKSGALTKDKIILDASSGNMACALAYYGAILGYQVEVVCNSKLTVDKRNFIEYFGAKCTVHGNITMEGNLKCKEMSSTEEGKNKYVFMDQLHNWENPRASYETLGPEIKRDLPNVKAVVGSMGSGGSMCGVATYFKETKSNVKIFCSQAASGTKIPGTGAFDDGDYITPFIKKIFDNSLMDDTEKVSQNQVELMTRLLANQGIFVGFQGGGVLQAAIECIKRNDIEGDVVAVMGDSGWKNMNKLMKTV